MHPKPSNANNTILPLSFLAVIINTAEKNGVPWKGKIAELEAAFPGDEFQSAVDAITDPKLEYPPYYLVKFHAYDEGNLHFLAAAEAGSATLSMCLRVWPDEVMTPVVALARLRASHLNAVLAAAPADWLQRPDFVAVDAGCSIGMSTQAVVDFLRARRPGLPDASVIGLDAGPQMLVIAARDADCGAKYVHGLAEDSKLADDSVDWFGLQFVVHECPAEATRAIFAEALRVLRPGGVLSMIDNDPTSPVIKGRPPAIATLLKATEPHSDSYYALDVEELMRVVGFVTASSVRSDPRHHTVVGVKG